MLSTSIINQQLAAQNQSISCTKMSESGKICALVKCFVFEASASRLVHISRASCGYDNSPWPLRLRFEECSHRRIFKLAAIRREICRDSTVIQRIDHCCADLRCLGDPRIHRGALAVARYKRSPPLHRRSRSARTRLRVPAHSAPANVRFTNALIQDLTLQVSLNGNKFGTTPPPSLRHRTFGWCGQRVPCGHGATLATPPRNSARHPCWRKRHNRARVSP